MVRHPALQATVEALQQFRFQITSEAELQEAVAAALTADGFRFEREVVLGLGDRIDFVVDVDGCQVGIECKVKGSPAEILRQVHRYVYHEQLAGLILVTTRVRHAIPPTMNDKPVEILRVRGLA